MGWGLRVGKESRCVCRGKANIITFRHDHNKTLSGPTYHSFNEFNQFLDHEAKKRYVRRSRNFESSPFCI